jgi:hypothetical protein
MFLCETLVHANKIVEIRIKLGFDEAFAVDRIGRSGELAIMWKNKVKCKIINYSQNFINAEISSDSWSSWRFTGFYGYPEHDRRRDSWDLLRSLSQDTSLPWCVMGDFNDMLSAEDKRGGTTQPNWLIRGFREAVQDSRLVDLPMEGYQFTWTKGRRVQNPTEERLDRALATQSWLDKFPQFKFINVIADRSDHSPILLRLIHQTKEFKARIFKFQNAWLDEQDLNGVVQDAWMKDTHDPLLSKLKRCTEDLESWSSKLRSRFTKSIAELREEMERNQDTTSELCVQKYQTARDSLTKVLKQEEDYWRQRAKTHWLRDGDSNTKFFHAIASARKKRNNIAKLMNNNGDVIQDQDGICTIAKEYFDHLFTQGTHADEEVTSLMHNRVTSEDNISLTKDFVIEEFKEALFSMHSDKAPGPDGLNPGFYKRFWDLCGKEIYNTSMQWLRRGRFPEHLNDTNIVLIPKVDNPTSMKDLRPISLCNVLYKILSKVLANRLKPLLNRYISAEQSAFIADRSILDNVMVAMETIHHMKCKVKGKVGEVALKIDISKAYDRVEWRYLLNVMRKMGFCEKWVKWINMCLDSIQYSVSVNGESVGPITPGRGLRQGDPLSPYLFILCAEGLTTLIKKSEGRGDIHGVKVCRGAPSLSHLLFADDCFLFFRADIREAQSMKKILNDYEGASGQAINYAKSEVYFSRNTPDTIKNQITDILGVTEVMGTGRYLGMPSMIGRNKRAMFGYLRDRMWKKVQSWSGKHLSKA